MQEVHSSVWRSKVKRFMSITFSMVKGGHCSRAGRRVMLENFIYKRRKRRTKRVGITSGMFLQDMDSSYHW